MPRPPRCAYREGTTQCRRIGAGNPPLCRPHRALLEHDVGPVTVGERVGSVIGKLFRGARVTKDELGEAFVDGLRMMGAVGGAARAPRPGDVPPPATPDAAGQPRSPFVDWAYEQLKQRTAQQGAQKAAEEAAKAKRTALLATAKADLGWKSKKTEELTIPEVNKRRRELAKKHHPDRPGGSLARMQRVNAAADLLVAHLEGAPARA
jgi:hypothetical protein